LERDGVRSKNNKQTFKTISKTMKNQFSKNLQIMKTSKITLGFNKLNDGQLEDQALAIAAAMNGNTHFPEPSPALADLNNGIQLFSNGLALAKTRDKVKVAVKNQLRDNLELLLIQLSNYCSFIAKGDRAILASSGFTLKAENSSPKILGSPENFSVKPGNNAGEAFVSINPARNAKGYLFLYGPSPMNNNAWFHVLNSQPYYTITGLVPGTTYSFKIGATGSKGQVVYTDIITKMVV
jgi:hypothetical protein